MTLKASTDRVSQLALGGSQDDVDWVMRKVILSKTLPAGSADDVVNWMMFYNSTLFDFLLYDIRFSPQAALTANGTNYLTLDLKYGDTAAASLSSALATQVTTASVSWVADTVIVFAGAGLGVSSVVPAGKYLWLLQASPGSGVARPITDWQITGRYV